MQAPTFKPHLRLYLAAIHGQFAEFRSIFNGLSEKDRERYFADTFPNEQGSEDSYSPLHFFAENGNEEGVRMLAQQFHFNLNQIASRWRKTPLGCAILDEHVDIIRFLLENGADPNRICGPGQVPLYLAVLSGNTTIVRLLLQHGADPHAVRGYFDDTTLTFSRSTALNVLLRSQKSKETKLDICRLFVQYGGCDSKFLQITLDNIITRLLEYEHVPVDSDRCVMLLEAGVKPSFQAMPLAIQAKNEPIFRLLLQYGVDPFRQDQNNEHYYGAAADADVDTKGLRLHARCSPFIEAAAICGQDNDEIGTVIFDSLLDQWEERFAAHGGKNSNGEYAIHHLLSSSSDSNVSLLPAIQRVMMQRQGAQDLMQKPGFFPFDLLAASNNASLDVIYFVLRHCANELVMVQLSSKTSSDP
jgi:hypothetical protein